jgi:dTDP-4-dehydrorhamnose reductase
VDALSRYDLGVLVAARDGLDPTSLPAARIADRGLRRPANVRLKVDKAAALLSTRLRGARDFLTPAQS